MKKNGAKVRYENDFLNLKNLGKRRSKLLRGLSYLKSLMYLGNSKELRLNESQGTSFIWDLSSVKNFLDLNFSLCPMLGTCCHFFQPTPTYATPTHATPQICPSHFPTKNIIILYSY